MSLSIRMEGREALEAQLNKVRADAEAEVRKLVVKRARSLERRAKKKAPKPPTPPEKSYQRTGMLVDGIEGRVTGEGLSYELHSAAPYSLFVEFSKRYGTPFMRPLLKSERRFLRKRSSKIWLDVIKRNRKS